MDTMDWTTKQGKTDNKVVGFYKEDCRQDYIE